MAFEHFVLLVAGENPEEKFAPYSMAAEVEPYILYKKSEAGEMRQKGIMYYKSFITDQTPEEVVAFANFKIEELENFEDDDEFFESIAKGMERDEEGNAIARHNPEGRFTTIRVAGIFANPFRLKNGEESYSAKKGDVNWDAMHLALPAVNTYTRLWEMCVDGDKPQNEIENDMWLNMKERKDYFLNFKDKDEFVASNTAFWAFAFIDQEGKYIDFEESGEKQFDWMTSFYEKFIEPLPDGCLLSLFECGRQ